MDKIHNSGINILELFPFVNFLKESGQVTHVFRGTPDSSIKNVDTHHESFS